MAVSRSSAFSFPAPREEPVLRVRKPRRAALVLSWLYQLVFWFLLALAGLEWAAGLVGHEPRGPIKSTITHLEDGGARKNVQARDTE